MKLPGIHLCGALSAGAFGMLAWLSRASAEVNVWSFLALMAIAWGAVLGAFFCARRFSERRSLLAAVWFWAVALRLIGLVAEPVLEDDWFRYLWDGRQFAMASNPYATAPAQHFTDESLPDDFQTILSNINYPEVPTIYAPVCQYLFLISYWIAPGELWPLKLFLIAADLITLALLLRMTSARNALLYAWCPLLVKEVAFTAHPEILGVVFIAGALCAAQSRRQMLTAVLCALAVGARIHALLLAPFVVWTSLIIPTEEQGWRERLQMSVQSAAVFVATLAVLYAPFWLQGSAADLDGLRAFLGEWEFNSSVFAVLKTLARPHAAKLACAILFLTFYAACFVRFIGIGIAMSKPESNTPALHHSITPFPSVRGDVIFGVFFLLSAVVNPWYLLWMLPFVALSPSITGTVALMVVTLSYLHGANLGWTGLGPFDHPKWLRPLEYGLILAAALFEWRRNLFPAKWKAG